MFDVLEDINARPKPFEFYTAADLWTDEYVSAQMLQCHLDPDVDLSSRNHAFIDRSADWIASEFALSQGARVADFGCGPGLYATRLAAKGTRVTGIDFSRRSVEYARTAAQERGLDIEYINQDYLTYETDQRFDLAIMIMCDFCALSPAQRHKLLRKFHTLLDSGGSVLLDAYGLAGFDQRMETSTYERGLLGGFWSADDYYGFLNTFKYNDEKVVLDKYTIFEKTRRRTVYNWLQYFSTDAIGHEFEQAGFGVARLWGDVAGSEFDPESTEFAVVANRH